MTDSPDMASWTKDYSDNSGVEFGVSYVRSSRKITITHVVDVDWPADELDWLIARLIITRENLKD